MMKKKILFLIIFLLYLPCSILAETTLYLKSGEIIKGSLVEEKEDKIVIKKYDSLLTINRDEIAKTVESQDGKIISRKENLPFSTAIITYDLKGARSGQAKLYLDAESNNLAIEEATATEIGGFSQEKKEKIIYDGKKAYVIDLKRKKGVLREGEREKDVILETFGEKMYFGQPVETETFLGKKCVVYETEMGNFYFWKGIGLKEEITNHPMGERFNWTKEAVDIQTDIPISDKIFQVPPGVEVKPLEEMVSEFGERTGEIIKEGKDQQRKYRERQKNRLLKQAKHDPEIKKIIDKATEEDGTINMVEAEKLLDQKKRKDIIESAREVGVDEKIIQKYATTDGSFDNLYKLRSFIWKKKEKLSEKISKIIQIARIYEREDNYKQALDKYDQAIEVLPSSSQAYRERARLYVAMGEYEKAIKDFSRLLKKDTYFRSLLFSQRADVYAKMKRYGDALKDYTQALEIAQKRRKKKLEQNKKLFEEMGEKGESLDLNSSVNYGVANLFKKRGETYREMEKYQQALNDFTKAIKLKPDGWVSGRCYFLRGLVYKSLGQTAKMRNDFKQAHKLGASLREGDAVGGLKHGESIWYYPDGTMKVKGHYTNGKKDGVFIWYNPNGTIKKRATYRKGKKI